jgi:nitrite reductase (NADH) large subunit
MKACRLDEIVPDTGVAVLLGAEQVAVFRVGQEIYAVGNRDPFSGANVLSRGIVGDLDGEPVVASPVYKQHFSLRTGRCIEDASVTVPVYRTLVEGADIQIFLTGEAQCRT